MSVKAPALVGAALLVLVSGCTSPSISLDGRAVAQQESNSIEAPPPTVAPTEFAAPVPLPPNGAMVLRAEFDRVASTYSGRLGLAYIPVGGGQVQVLGDWSTGVAWSTIKVPLAVAALRASASNGLSSATSAIVNSDNAAAENLWASLGDATSAASAVEQVLTDGGDAATDVQDTRIRDGYTPFGQTDWSLVQQAQFSSELQCVDTGPTVVELMHRVSSDQSWGLGRLPGSAFKGGWGPSDDGSYLVRQLGILEVAGGYTAVAIAAESASGSFYDGITMLDALAEMLGAHSDLLPFGRCA
ncbi:hypothetical protein CH289_18000 [Rhodococcus sp. RS1C4]|uniref:hypothetical protein n=1 Tax=Rhodococcoides fascians TaxID=1828 RepID=UPI00068D19E0|nr:MULTISPECIES: hypothetical protein [Rhodococcus]OZC49073.1 hypothetical protein CH289_18000 [Rhodococcus sp. RS1C4]